MERVNSTGGFFWGVMLTRVAFDTMVKRSILGGWDASLLTLGLPHHLETLHHPAKNMPEKTNCHLEDNKNSIRHLSYVQVTCLRRYSADSKL